uniref:Uncharacterized protein n=1 Tax=Arundo donax TaxID=35708 RepID=A0A0A9AKA8_ARUDO
MQHVTMHQGNSCERRQTQRVGHYSPDTRLSNTYEGCPPDCIAPAGSLASFLHSVMLNVCILAMRLHTAGDDDLVRVMLASSCWSLATRRTRRLHGARMRVIGMIQIASSSISIAAWFL